MTVIHYYILHCNCDGNGNCSCSSSGSRMGSSGSSSETIWCIFKATALSVNRGTGRIGEVQATSRQPSQRFSQDPAIEVGQGGETLMEWMSTWRPEQIIFCPLPSTHVDDGLLQDECLVAECITTVIYIIFTFVYLQHHQTRWFWHPEIFMEC